MSRLPETFLLRTSDWWLWTPVVSPAGLLKASSAPSARENRGTVSFYKSSVNIRQSFSFCISQKERNSDRLGATWVRNLITSPQNQRTMANESMNLIRVLSFRIYRLFQHLHLIQSLWEIHNSAQMKCSKQSRKSSVSEGCSYRLFLLLSIWNLWLPHELAVLHTLLQNLQHALLYKNTQRSAKNLFRSRIFRLESTDPEVAIMGGLAIITTFTDIDIITVSFCFPKTNIRTLKG